VNVTKQSKDKPARLWVVPVVVVPLLAAGLWLTFGDGEAPAFACGGGEAKDVQTAPDDFRAFTDDSYWNTPLPEDAPVDENSDDMIEYLQEDSAADYIELAGASESGEWGNPIYFSDRSDKNCVIENSCEQHQPPEFRRVRIPSHAGHDPTSDAAMTVYDVDKGLMYGFYEARFDAGADSWSACGGTIYYLESNGLEGRLEEADEERNFGHRGVPPSTYAVRHEEITSGEIDHVLKIAVNRASKEYVWPMTGSDGESDEPFAPPEGARLRLKPSIDLESLDLTDAERTIATALQEYGAVIGDQSGSKVVLKVENTVAEGRGQLWEGILEPDSLEPFSIDDFEFIQLGFGQS
jgi:hypothetical protein